MKRELCNVNKVVAGDLQRSVSRLILCSILPNMKKGANGICERHKAGEVHQHTGGSDSPELHNLKDYCMEKG